jgi:aconitate hydratase
MNSFDSEGTLGGPGESLRIHRLDAVPGSEELPFSHKIMLENLLRHEDGSTVTEADIRAVVGVGRSDHDIAFHPSRVFLHDTNGVPVLTDLAALRDAVAGAGRDPSIVDLVIPAELTVDHSVVTDFHGRSDAPRLNVEREYERNAERYRFLKWGRDAFAGLKVVPPGAGIMHQINVEYLAQVVTSRDGWAFPDTVAGTDSHTTMVNGLSVLAWGVGGIEAEAAMLGQPISMLIPPVLGVELVGELRPGTTATDLVLTITERMRAEGVVGSFVEFFGSGVAATSIATRCTIANMSPEFGSTAAIFPIDALTLDFLRFTGRNGEHVDRVERYAKEQGLWHVPERRLRFDRTVTIDLDGVVPSLAGPRRPQDRVALDGAHRAFRTSLADMGGELPSNDVTDDVPQNGAVAIASITSCTNTSNPAVMVAAGLLARNAVERGLQSRPWVKTSLAPGSRVVTDYLERAGLSTHLDALGFNLVGYGCMTCIGNSGSLLPDIAEMIESDGLIAASVLSGNRNFDGRINNDVSMNFLASPPLVVAYAIAGSLDRDLVNEPLGVDQQGVPVFLADIWPREDEIDAVISGSIDPSMYVSTYEHIFDGDENWQSLSAPTGAVFEWDPESTYLRRPPFLDGAVLHARPLADITGARVLEMLGDSVTTDHICPAGRIPAGSASGRMLVEQGVPVSELSSYAARRGNWEVMERGGFANQRLRNGLAPDASGGRTRDFTDGGKVTDVYVASRHYREQGVPLVVLGGKEYGTGSSRDWAAKVTALLGVHVVIAESFERIHRSNLVNMGVLPLQHEPGVTNALLGLTGEETFDVRGLDGSDDAPETVTVTATRADGVVIDFTAVVRLDTPREQVYYRHGGILPYVLAELLSADEPSTSSE